MSISYPPSTGLEARGFKLPLPHVLTGLLIAAAFGWQLLLGVNPDTTWLTVMAERWLEGERLFVDIHENNPPASIYIYAPVVFAGNALGIRSELALQILTVLLFLGAAFTAFKMLVRAGHERQFHFGWLLTASVVLFLIMPVSSFGQREHIAAILTLPVIGLGAIRCAGKRPDVWMVVLAGLAMGCVAAIKPPLVSIAIFVSILAATYTRSWRAIFAWENWIGAAVFAAYIAAIVFLHPAFMRDVMPLLNDVYLPNRMMLLMVVSPAFWVIIGLAFHAIMMHRADWRSSPSSLVYAAAGGYFFSYIIQMKFFDYHALPVSTFLMLALCMGIFQLRRDAGDAGQTSFAMPRPMQMMSLAIVVLLGGFNVYDFYTRQYNGNLTRVVRAINPAATVLGFGMVPGSQIRAIRNAGGSWTGSFGYTYVPGYAAWYRKNKVVDAAWGARLDHWERWTADVSTSDIIAKKPDIILLRDEELVKWPAWIKRYPDLAKAMSGYRFDRKVNVGRGVYPVLVYVRNAKAGGSATLPNQDKK